MDEATMLEAGFPRTCHVASDLRQGDLFAIHVEDEARDLAHSVQSSLYKVHVIIRCAPYRRYDLPLWWPVRIAHTLTQEQRDAIAHKRAEVFSKMLDRVFGGVK